MSERFVPISPDVLQRSDLAAEAILLYEFLVDQQTSADGLVFYGKAVSYAWIQSRYLRSSLRSLKRYMRALKDAGFVAVAREFHGGIRIRLPRSVKFAKPAPPPAVQLSLYSPAPTPILQGRRSVENPVEKQCKSSESPENNRATVGPTVVPRLAPEGSRKQVEEKFRTVMWAHAVPRVEKTQKQLEDRRRLLLKQAEMLQQKYQTSG